MVQEPMRSGERKLVRPARKTQADSSPPSVTASRSQSPAVLLVASPIVWRRAPQVALLPQGRPLLGANPNSEDGTRRHTRAVIRVSRTLPTRRRVDETLIARRGDWHGVLQQTLAHVRALSCEIDASIQVWGRIKTAASILQKTTSRPLGAREIFDIIGVRAITRNTQDCYRLVALIHLDYFALEAEYDDYVLAPKASGYQALHTTVVDRSGIPVEVQVRTVSMNDFAEQGPAAHPDYKRHQHRGWAQ